MFCKRVPHTDARPFRTALAVTLLAPKRKKVQSVGNALHFGYLLFARATRVMAAPHRVTVGLKDNV
jgi:hypothetical protein